MINIAGPASRKMPGLFVHKREDYFLVRVVLVPAT